MVIYVNNISYNMPLNLRGSLAYIAKTAPIRMIFATDPTKSFIIPRKNTPEAEQILKTEMEKILEADAILKLDDDFVLSEHSIGQDLARLERCLSEVLHIPFLDSWSFLRELIGRDSFYE